MASNMDEKKSGLLTRRQALLSIATITAGAAVLPRTVFGATPAKDKIKFLALGDFGTGDVRRKVDDVARSRERAVAVGAAAPWLFRYGEALFGSDEDDFIAGIRLWIGGRDEIDSTTNGEDFAPAPPLVKRGSLLGQVTPMAKTLRT